MKKDDLTQVKNIGNARRNILANHGITTVQQLYDIPLEKLMQIKSLGQHYAKLIKAAVNDLYALKNVPVINNARHLKSTSTELVTLTEVWIQTFSKMPKAVPRT